MVQVKRVYKVLEKREQFTGLEVNPSCPCKGRRVSKAILHGLLNEELL